MLGAIPPSGAPDVVGAFRFICTAGQIERDDPIVFPGQPDQSHLHQFFGNTGANAFSTFNAPNCWNGKDLYSPNLRDHVAYTSYGSWGYEKCPATHPYVIPTFTLGAWYTFDADLDRSGTWDVKRPTWNLSSDDMSAMGHGVMRPGSMLHADWWGAWDDPTMDEWTAVCIDKLLNCNGGSLGNGWQMKQDQPLNYNAESRLVPIPARP